MTLLPYPLAHARRFGVTENSQPVQSNRLASSAQAITLGVEEAIRKEVTHGLNLLAL